MDQNSSSRMRHTPPVTRRSRSKTRDSRDRRKRRSTRSRSQHGHSSNRHRDSHITDGRDGCRRSRQSEPRRRDSSRPRSSRRSRSRRRDRCHTCVSRRDRTTSYRSRSPIERRPVELQLEDGQHMDTGKSEGPSATSIKKADDREFCKLDDYDLMSDLRDIMVKYYPPPAWEARFPSASIPNTVSSSFISVETSDITLPTPEPIPTPEPTISEIFYTMISNTVDKVIYVHVDEHDLLYDTAYVELMKAVEQAMEIPVIEIRADIAELFNNAYYYFEMQIKAKEKLAAAQAWEKRMRKKLKRYLRRQKNFRGYETPPTPKSVVSSHESYRKPPMRPCECHVKINYNRYDKDRFGIYLPRKEEFSKNNVTTTPACSSEGVEDDKISMCRTSTRTHSASSSKKERTVSEGET